MCVCWCFVCVVVVCCRLCVLYCLPSLGTVCWLLVFVGLLVSLDGRCTYLTMTVTALLWGRSKGVAITFLRFLMSLTRLFISSVNSVFAFAGGISR